ncbi:MAG: DUF4168 domain-containing protein [Nodosilinea sp.]
MTTAIRRHLIGLSRAVRWQWRYRLSWLGLSLIALLLLGDGLPAAAAPVVTTVDDPAPGMVTVAPDANDIPSETVSRFVKAYIDVVKLIESRELSLQRAETDTESSQMQQEIQAAALDLIQANGLTLTAYWELLGLANSDPEFRDRVLAQIDEASL